MCYNYTMDKKFVYAPKLYLGDGIKAKNLDKIKKKLENKPLFANVFLLTFATAESDQLEFFDARILTKRHYEGYVPYIIGIAADKREAIELVEQIVKECLEKRGDCSLREYLSC